MQEVYSLLHTSSSQERLGGGPMHSLRVFRYAVREDAMAVSFNVMTLFWAAVKAAWAATMKSNIFCLVSAFCTAIIQTPKKRGNRQSGNPNHVVNI